MLVLLAWLFISIRLLSKNRLSKCGLGNGLVLEKVMLVEYEGGSVAGKVIPGPVVCLLRSGGFVVDVGDVTVDVVNLPETDVATVVVAAAALVVGVVAMVVVVAVVVVDDVVVVAVNDGDGGFASDTLDVARDFSSIFSELEFSEDDGLDAFDVLEETLSAFSTCAVFDVSFLLSTLGLSAFFPVKVSRGLGLAMETRQGSRYPIHARFRAPRSRSGTKARL